MTANDTFDLKFTSREARWLFDKLKLKAITLDVDSSVITRWAHKWRAQPKATTQKTTDVPAIIPCWPLWPIGAWWLTFGCARATPMRSTMRWAFSKKH